MCCEGEMAGRRPVPYFDPLWYRETYVIPPGQGALAHFLTHRRSQAFSPTPLFDVGWYVEQHPGELAGNRDPFAHFLQAGTYRDIDPSPAFRHSGLSQAASRPAEPPVPPDRCILTATIRWYIICAPPITEAEAKSGVPARAHGAYVALMTLDLTRAATELAANGYTTLRVLDADNVPRACGAV